VKKNADLAVPILTQSAGSATEMVSAANTHIVTIKLSPDWATATDVQTATTAWETENTRLDEQNQLVAELENKLKTARSNQRALMRRWDVRKRGLLSAVDAACNGSKDKVQAFGFGVQQRTALPLAEVPEGLRGRRSKRVGTATAVWNAPRGHQGFIVQYATDLTNPATYSPLIMVSRGKFEVTGQTPGSKVYFRVLALEPSLPTGQTEFTPWVEVMVSA
jgi:hypothetical protein